MKSSSISTRVAYGVEFQSDLLPVHYALFVTNMPAEELDDILPVYLASLPPAWKLDAVITHQREGAGQFLFGGSSNSALGLTGCLQRFV